MWKGIGGGWVGGAWFVWCFVWGGCMEGMVCYLVIIVHVGRNVQPVGAGDAVLTRSGCIGMLCSLWRERK